MMCSVKTPSLKIHTWLQALCLSACFCFGNSVVMQAQQVALQSPAGTKFYLYTPPGYTASNTYPLLAYFHGGGDINPTNNLSKLLEDFSPHTSPPWLINKGRWPYNQFIVVSPLLNKDTGVPNPNDQTWPMAVMDEVIEYVKSTYSVNADKVYLTGMSLGGAACWDYAGTYPAKVAGVVTFSANTDLAKACATTDVPVWVFHGTDDGLVLPAKSITMVNAMNACAGAKYKPHLQMLFGRYHEGWNEVWQGTNGYLVFDWLLQFTKNDNSNKSPYVNAGQDFKFVNRSTLHIAGDYFDIDGSVTSAQWTQIGSTPSVATMEGTTTKFLKLSNLQPGTYQFRLTATDDDGVQSSDDVSVEIVAAETGAAITNISLINGSTDGVIMSLTDGMTINKNTIGATQFNFRATQNTTANTTRFSVSTDRYTKLIGTKPEPQLMVASSQFSELILPLGEYNICATAYAGTYGQGSPNISLCYKINVINEVVTIKQLYPKAGADISLLTSWGLNADGTGTAPTSFLDNNQIFNIDKTVTQNGAWQIGGTGSTLTVKNGGNLTINNTHSSAINMEGNGVVNVNTASPITFGTVGASTTINYMQNAVSIPKITYGHLSFAGTSTKTLAAGNTTVTGDVTIANNAIVQGAADNTSALLIGGTLTINEDAAFNPPVKFAIQLTRGSAQTISTQSALVSLNQLTLSANTVAQLNASQPVTFELGSAAGGGLVINTGASLAIGANTLSLVNKGTLNGSNETGRLSINNGNLVVASNTAINSNLYVVPGSDRIRALAVDLTGGGTLNIQSPVNIIDSVKGFNGTIQANGNLSLVSTKTKTARIAAFQGTGAIAGNVEFQRSVDGADKYKYITIPVSGATVQTFQNFLPVTGNFTGHSTGNGLPETAASMFYYNEPGTGWTPYPASANIEQFSIGRGYSFYVWAPNVETIVKVKGPIHQGNFNFSLTPDPNLSQADDGWNLVGNPYASPILWSVGGGWTSSGVSPASYVRDNMTGNGRFLVWDGSTGDAEFSGLIAAGQSFWVRTTSALPQLTVSELSKTNTSDVTFWRTAQNDATVVPSLSVEMKQGSLIDRTYLKFVAGATDGFDTDMDALKKKNGYFNIASLTGDATVLAINALNAGGPCGRDISLSVQTITQGSYQLNFAGALLDDTMREIFLVDNFTNTRTKLGKNVTYEFAVTESAASTGVERFKIVFQASAVRPAVEVTGNVMSSNFTTGNQWYRNNEAIAGATAQSYEPVQSGSYHVQVSAGGCSIVSAVVPFSVTGLVERLSDLRVYPNPASSYIRVVGDNAVGTVRYAILNAYGSEVQRGEISGSAWREGADIMFARAMQAGFYVLKLEGGTYSRVVKFTVQ